MKVDVVETTPEILDELDELARDIDRIEVWYQTGQNLRDCLEISFDHSTVCRAGYGDGVLGCVWGVCLADIREKRGVPWLIGTDTLEAHAIPFLRNCCYHLNEMKDGYDYLSNDVYAENKTSVRWLRWMGFKFGEARPFGPFLQPFHHFTWRRE